ncbi:hypothetical protein SAMN06265338_101693 [Rhodoblastus acidophilus]|uniref:Beta/Gamma crystallin n=1 Tax=Rhodoblastus acidophilus TaxID=1074 RepID=A0A212QKM1_RHOAC|nr:hypothetical protein [Rhodoblastus acidophilus]MCW2317556.1 hypothetical protein [Rhodoblastus acidophilus]PPQ39901.1 hypothetical protein CKO16_03615 [Rhodoblastus acidophilus]RAI18469.1 hypothetical protein CH337_14125 [Rhodoblastus acidophilus]SNB59884.1 hypothetical protein SAMN06265338_101693 [Rhodoblastus acidophilus]
MLLSRSALAAATFGFLTLAGSGVVLAAGASAPHTFPAEDRAIPYSGDLPSCDDFGILGAIKDQFDSKQFWFGDNDLSIVAFEQVGELGYRKHGEEFIPRRYCEVKALFNDGRPREVKYNIIERGGFVGFGPGVEFCAVGEDKARAYPPHCSGAVR